MPPAHPARRWRCGTGRCSRCSTAPARGSPRPSGSTWTTSTCPIPQRRALAPYACAARAARSGWCRSGPTPAQAVDTYLVRGRPDLAGLDTVEPDPRQRGSAVPQRPRRSALPAERLGRAGQGRRAGRGHRRGLPAHPAALVRHPPARRRRRRARRPGAARARLGDDHPGLHAWSRSTACARCTPPHTRAPWSDPRGHVQRPRLVTNCRFRAADPAVGDQTATSAGKSTNGPARLPGRPDPDGRLIGVTP